MAGIECSLNQSQFFSDKVANNNDSERCQDNSNGNRHHFDPLLFLIGWQAWIVHDFRDITNAGTNGDIKNNLHIGNRGGQQKAVQ